MTLSSASRSEPAPVPQTRLARACLDSDDDSVDSERQRGSVIAPGFKGSNWLVEPAIDALAAAAMMRPLAQIMF